MRIVECLKGDVYNPTARPDIEPEELRRRELEFEDLVAREGVYDYVLEVWNPEVDGGMGS